MSQTVITQAFVEWKTQQAIDNQPVTLDEFIFAFVPGQDDTQPIDNTEAIPTDKIVYRQAVGKTGVVNANAVVYSVTMGADVGDFDFNWIGLVNKASGTLAMIIHAPTQRKVQNASGQQGNVLVRSMLMEYSGAQTATNITTPAETWQIDFTARLAGMDEAVRLAALDIYGAGAFFDTGFLVAKTGTQYFVTKGLGYVGGLRAALAANQNVSVSAKPTKVWADVCYQGTLTSAYKTAITFTVADTLEDHITDGVAHFVFALASIDAAGAITDLRPKGSLADQTFLRKDKNLTDIANPATALKTLGGVPTGRTVNKKPLSEDINIGPDDVGALPAGGTAVAAKKLETARKIAGIAFDGTKDISLSPDNVGALPSGGTAVAATKLATARKIAGVPFDGTQDIGITAENVGALTQTQADGRYYKVSGGTINGDVSVEGTALVTKNGVTTSTDGKTRFTNGYRIKGYGEQFSDSFFEEKIGSYVQWGLHVVSGGSGAYLTFSHTGNLTAPTVSDASGRVYSAGNPPPPPESTWNLAIGARIFAQVNAGGGTLYPGATLSGSRLIPASVFFSTATRAAIHAEGGNLAGTWMTLGYISDADSAQASCTMFVRIA